MHNLFDAFRLHPDDTINGIEMTQMDRSIYEHTPRQCREPVLPHMVHKPQPPRHGRLELVAKDLGISYKDAHRVVSLLKVLGDDGRIYRSILATPRDKLRQYTRRLEDIANDIATVPDGTLPTDPAHITNVPDAIWHTIGSHTLRSSLPGRTVPITPQVLISDDDDQSSDPDTKTPSDVYRYHTIPDTRRPQTTWLYWQPQWYRHLIRTIRIADTMTLDRLTRIIATTTWHDIRELTAIRGFTNPMRDLYWRLIRSRDLPFLGSRIHPDIRNIHPDMTDAEIRAVVRLWLDVIPPMRGDRLTVAKDAIQARRDAIISSSRPTSHRYAIAWLAARLRACKTMQQLRSTSAMLHDVLSGKAGTPYGVPTVTLSERRRLWILRKQCLKRIQRHADTSRYQYPQGAYCLLAT